MTILVTGAAGFIGMHLCERLLKRGHRVVGIDNLSAYYDPRLKVLRLSRLQEFDKFETVLADVDDHERLADLFADCQPTRVVHLAAQAGVRHSIDHPFDYQKSNLAAHLSVLEACRHADGVEHLVYASSSSVYGNRPRVGEAFSEDDPVIDPQSLYAATKLGCELMSTSYANLYGMAQTGLRFFTVYGDYGRPDMAYFKFVTEALAGRAIDIYGDGNMSRDFTHVDDIVEAITRLIDLPPQPAVNRILNIGGGHPVNLMDMVQQLESVLGIPIQKNMLPMQAGDVRRTFADCSRLVALTGFRPEKPLDEGLAAFVSWYRAIYAPLVASTSPAP